jgi:hypothetical protein
MKPGNTIVTVWGHDVTLNLEAPRRDIEVEFLDQLAIRFGVTDKIKFRIAVTTLAKEYDDLNDKKDELLLAVAELISKTYQIDWEIMFEAHLQLMVLRRRILIESEEADQ